MHYRLQLKIVENMEKKLVLEIATLGMFKNRRLSSAEKYLRR